MRFISFVQNALRSMGVSITRSTKVAVHQTMWGHITPSSAVLPEILPDQALAPATASPAR